MRSAWRCSARSRSRWRRRCARGGKQLLPLLKVGEQSVVQGRSQLAHGLVVLQLAFSILLLTSAGLAYRSLSLRDSLDVGFDTRHILLATVNTSGGATAAEANAADPAIAANATRRHARRRTGLVRAPDAGFRAGWISRCAGAIAPSRCWPQTIAWLELFLGGRRAVRRRSDFRTSLAGRCGRPAGPGPFGDRHAAPRRAAVARRIGDSARRCSPDRPSGRSAARGHRRGGGCVLHAAA